MKNYHLCGGMLPPYSNFANKIYQMVGCSHPTVELDRGIGSFRWWNVSTIQQIEDVRVVGWEYPTTREQQCTNNTKQPIIISDTKSVGWEYPTKKLHIINHLYKRLKNA